MCRGVPYTVRSLKALRPWYARAAKKAAVWAAAAAGDVVGTRDPTQKLAVHLVVAFLRQLVSVGDEDGLLENSVREPIALRLGPRVLGGFPRFQRTRRSPSQSHWSKGW